jgi:hypothetical protein
MSAATDFLHHPRSWNDWYRFARDELGLAHDERVEYANHRYVEEQNRRSLRLREEKLDPRSA